MRRRLLFALAGLLLSAMVVILALPLWLGTALRFGGQSRGLHFASYEPRGYGRFVLRDVELRRQNVRITATIAEANTPLVWGWHRLRGLPNYIVAGAWTVEVTKPAQPAAPKTPTPSGWVPVRGTLQKVAAQLERWLPEARAGAGVVRFPGGEITLGSAHWKNGTLDVQNLAFLRPSATKGANAPAAAPPPPNAGSPAVVAQSVPGLPAVNGTIQFGPDASLLRVALHAVDDSAAATLESRGAGVAANVTWYGQPAAVKAEFANHGWLPRTASLVADNWDLPAARLKLGDSYSAVQGHARIQWAAERFSADIALHSQPLPAKKAVPPLDIVLQGQGDAQAFTVESLHAAVPGVNAQLNAPVSVDRAGKIAGPAVFAVAIDLAKQPWFAARGAASGEARLVTGATRIPVVEFQVDGRDLSAQGFAASHVTATGRFEWPRVEVSRAILVGTDGEQLEARGGYDIKAKALLPSTVTGKLRRASLARWLPAQPGFEAITVDANASGPLNNLQHAGRASADRVAFSGVKPLALAVEWRANGAAIEMLDAHISAGATTLAIAGALNRTGARLSRFDLAQGGAERLKLAEPAMIRWRTAGSPADTPLLQLDSLKLIGPDASLVAGVVWGPIGHVSVAAQNIDSSWLKDLLSTDGPEWKIASLAAKGDWDRGPIAFSLTAGAAMDVGAGKNAAINLAARGDQHGIVIDALRAIESGATVVNASGHAPIVVYPGASPLVRFDDNGALALDATTAPQAMLWRQLATLTGVELQEPQASVHLTGTWLRPEGQFSMQAARVAMDARKFSRPIPTIERLDINATGDRGGITLERFAISVEGQVVRGRGRLPLRNADWRELVKHPAATLQRDAEAHVEIPDAEISVFARFLPAALAPLGRLQVDADYKAGSVTGMLRLRNAASRPLGPLGVLQEINADVRLGGRTLTLEGVTAKAGGQPVTLTGTVALPAGKSATGNNAAAITPVFDLALRGENLPFVRQTGLLVRGDLDLRLQTPKQNGAPPQISGAVRLRDSLFLADVRAFLPKGGASNPLRRPPYFSIPTPPLNSWTLAVDLTGERFMRVRMPVFNGLASAHFQLGGTLGEPRAIGDVTIDEGQVTMPFATFDVKQAIVRLTEADPFEPTIFLRGTARRYGYDIAMEIDGRASAPNLVFTSSPALDSEQVLLMVMTGAVPSNDIATSGTQRVASIGFFLGQGLIGSLLGGNAASADRLTITSGEKVSRQGNETYDIEYKVNDRWTAVAERNEFDEWSAGMKWRVLPRGRASAEPKKPAPNTEVARGAK